MKHDATSVPTRPPVGIPSASLADRGIQPPKRYGIYRAKTTGRLDGPGDNWSWRVMITRDGKPLCNKSFADKRYGDARQALQAAMDFRDRILARCQPMRKRERQQMLRRNNTSGLAGVCRCTSRGRDYYIAQTLLPDGTRLRRAFAIAKHGEQKALELAAAERQRQLARIEGETERDTGAVPPER
ncbi:hypothetical protein FCE95_00030 [Luteimonas gilva]|uniref:AP2 domain-containing protein n=1 Tax=Luteimonas gilva TaxID=2572684 RepID=A0A4U5K1G7_9GAMM|nr:hypothetical protein [Luteimonas gilva]TKR32759.1 hypothetical protein FCE95_00030 [Luteimonas gilva]